MKPTRVFYFSVSVFILFYFLFSGLFSFVGSTDSLQNADTDVAQWTFKADSHIACRVHAAPIPFPCHATPLSVYNVSFPFYLNSVAVSDSHLSCNAHAMLRPCRSSQGHVTAQHSRAVLWSTAWSEHGMASVNQTRPHCLNPMGKTHSKLLATRYGRGMGTACYVWIGL